MNLKPGLTISAVIVIFMFALSGWAWTQVPADAQIPVHWGVEGTPDRYGGKGEALLLIPLVTLGIAALFAVIPRIEPRRANLAKSGRAYTTVWITMAGFMAVMHVVMVLGALGREVDMNRVVFGIVGILFVAIGQVLAGIRSNFFFGIRTPWTLSSELSWSRTHRLGGRLFTLVGVATLLATPLDSGPLLLVIAVGGALAAALTAIVYSYVVWRDDESKQPLGR